MTTHPKALALLAAAILAAAPALAQEKAGPVKRLGKTVVQFDDGTIRAILGWRWASANAKEPWIVLDFFFSAAGSDPVEVAREDVTLLTPSGERINLPSQKKLAEGVPNVRGVLKAFDVSRDPIGGYFPGRVHEQPLRFFSIPNEGITFDTASADRNIVTYGDIWFQSPKTYFDEGEYRLEIRNRKLDASLPFRIPADDVKKKGTEEAVPAAK